MTTTNESSKRSEHRKNEEHNSPPQDLQESEDEGHQNLVLYNNNAKLNNLDLFILTQPLKFMIQIHERLQNPTSNDV